VARSSKLRAIPAFIMPMAARVVEKLPESDDWIYELKFDGYRALLLKDGKRVHIRSRNDKDLTRMYPRVAAQAGRLDADQAIVDGEIVAIDQQGRPSFQALQHRGSHPDHQTVFYAFDVLYLNGIDLTGEPLLKRRARLPALLDDSGLLLSKELPGTAAEIVEAVCGLGLEGVIAKRKTSVYQAGERTDDWRKLKLERQQEFVIGGYRPGPNGIDALLIGYYEGKGLCFAGKVRAGLVPYVRRDLLKKLRPLEIERCPFANLPSAGSSRWGGGVTAEEMHEMRWVKPKPVAQVRFVEWTAEGRLRHAAFLGLRTDKAAKDVRRE
jgi:bifunctional non-homologous end joining protein LigD